MNGDLKANVSFQTDHSLLQRLFQQAELKCARNRKDFGGRKVLIEGGGYEKIWLETQPMGGEMYAKRDPETARNNIQLFMEFIREDGRLPGSIAYINGKMIPQYNKIQGFYFAEPALNLYYLLGKDKDYLDLLQSTLIRFDSYLWTKRDSDGDGCLESFCKYDTGEDHAERYADAPDAWEAEEPPENCLVVPMASIDFMSFSYSCRATLQKICEIRRQEEQAKGWKTKAEAVRKKITEYLWDEERGACFDRDRFHRTLPTLTHNSLRAMYAHSLTDRQADEFIKRHLLNTAEFFTKMPLPSVAVNDPLFRNISTNNWSGQVEALTYQRAIRAFENYGKEPLLPIFGQKLFQAILPECIFVQQYDPFTMKPSKVSLTGEQDAYGPAILSVLEYIAHIYGIHRKEEQIIFSGGRGIACEYCQKWGEDTYRLENDGKKMAAYQNGKLLFECETGDQVITTLDGIVIGKKPLYEKQEKEQVTEYEV